LKGKERGVVNLSTLNVATDSRCVLELQGILQLLAKHVRVKQGTIKVSAFGKKTDRCETISKQSSL